MKQIVDYIDFRKFMQDFYDEKKRTSAFSWREFSKRAGFTSPNYMKVVCDGKSKLSKIGVERTAAAMNLVGFEVEYFGAMVEFGQASSEEKKKAAYEKMLAIAKAHKVRILDAKFFTYFESWKYPVLRELAPMMPRTTPSEIAGMCRPKISAAEVQESLNFLTKNKLLKKKSEGVYEQTEANIKGSPEAAQMAFLSMHRQMAGFAVEALELPSKEQNFSGITMSLSRGSYEKIVNALDECRKKIVSIATEDEETDRVYRLNLQLFPLTKNTRS